MTKFELLKYIVLGICGLCGLVGIGMLFVATAMVEGTGTQEQITAMLVRGLILCGIFATAMYLNYRER